MKKQHQVTSFFVIVLLLVLNSLCFAQQPAPKVGKGVKTGTGASGAGAAPTAPKVGKGITRPKEEPVKIVTRTEKIVIKANEGFLNIVGVPGAQVTLTRVAKVRTRVGQGVTVLKNEVIKDDDGVLNISGIVPGKYQVVIRHPDYQQPYSEQHEISKGEQTKISALNKLVSKYGEIVIVGAPADAAVLLDGKKPELGNTKVDEQGSITITRVPVGEHSLKVGKASYDDLNIEKLEIKPGEKEYVSAKLAGVSVTLTVNAKPQARVYLNNIERGVVQPDGVLRVTGLAPGGYKMRVTLDGYETAESNLTLKLEERNPIVPVSLVPVTEAEEATISASAPQRNWAPAPANWTFERPGILVRGDAPVLFKEVNEQGRFNNYRDFKLVLDLRFANGKGAAWILRAKDHRNYYLFELATSRSESKRKLFNFYLCREGKLELVNSIDVVDDIDNPQAFFYLEIHARGNQFSHKLRVSTDAQPQARSLGVFTDRNNTFSIGGIGFQGLRGIEMLVQDLHVFPVKRTGN